MEQAVDRIYQQQSLSYPHDYDHGWQVLDVDMSGMPCGPKAAFARHRLFRQAVQSAWTTTGPRAGELL